MVPPWRGLEKPRSGSYLLQLVAKFAAQPRNFPVGRRIRRPSQRVSRPARRIRRRNRGIPRSPRPISRPLRRVSRPRRRIRRPHRRIRRRHRRARQAHRRIRRPHRRIRRRHRRARQAHRRIRRPVANQSSANGEPSPACRGECRRAAGPPRQSADARPSSRSRRLHRESRRASGAESALVEMCAAAVGDLARPAPCCTAGSTRAPRGRPCR